MYNFILNYPQLIGKRMPATQSFKPQNGRVYKGYTIVVPYSMLMFKALLQTCDAIRKEYISQPLLHRETFPTPLPGPIPLVFPLGTSLILQGNAKKEEEGEEEERGGGGG